MGHYSDAYEREDDERIKQEARDRAKLLAKIKQDRLAHGIDEVLVRIAKGEYR